MTGMIGTVDRLEDFAAILRDRFPLESAFVAVSKPRVFVRESNKGAPSYHCATVFSTVAHANLECTVLSGELAIDPKDPGAQKKLEAFREEFFTKTLCEFRGMFEEGDQVPMLYEGSARASESSGQAVELGRLGEAVAELVSAIREGPRVESEAPEVPEPTEKPDEPEKPAKEGITGAKEGPACSA